ncbi:DinB family protein [Chitinophaga skermanii]|uniref:DinB family protein n=1 Tax=Chitinophaga skermanii TaxID=331697 RepID=A0A327Q3V0_9BACT|nr:DinB family protein [Chitinophaga skermanii]RAI98411.1 DinB family protein [Chitinophaga skermanii]
MNKHTIHEQLNTRFNDFATFVKGLSNHRFVVSPEGKWSAGQQLDHLIKSVKPVNAALNMPKMLLRFWGTPKRPNMPYDELVAEYQQVLAAGGTTTRAYLPSIISEHQRDTLLKNYFQQKDKLLLQLGKWSEEELDKYQLPHPLLGKISMREVLYFTMYHTEHHLQTLQQREMPKKSWTDQLEQLLQ